MCGEGGGGNRLWEVITTVETPESGCGENLDGREGSVGVLCWEGGGR